MKRTLLYLGIALLMLISVVADGNTTYNNTISCVTQTSKSLGLGALFSGLALFCFAMLIAFVVIGKDDI